jgi:hypothetical protein
MMILLPSRIVLVLGWWWCCWSWSWSNIITTVHAEEVQDGGGGGDSSTSSATILQDLYSCDDPNDPNNLISCDVDTMLWDLDALRPDQSPDTSQVCIELVQILVDAQQDQDESTTIMFDEILSTVVVDALEPCVLWAMEYGALSQTDYNNENNNNNINNNNNDDDDNENDIDDTNNSNNNASNQGEDEVLNGGKKIKSNVWTKWTQDTTQPHVVHVCLW